MFRDASHALLGLENAMKKTENKKKVKKIR